MLFAVSAAWAGLATDDFNRANTPESGDTSLIGLHWKQEGSANTWYINGNELHANLHAAPAILYNDERETSCGNGHSFTLSLDVAGRVDNTWPGVAFNYNNPTNFYVVRFKPGSFYYQFLGMRSDGSWHVILSAHAAGNADFVADTPYTITVSSDTAYTYEFTIQETATGTVMASRTVTDSENNSRGGYAAPYLSSGAGQYGRYDNFSLETTYDPPTIELRGIANP